MQTAEVEFTAERYRTYEPFSLDINGYSLEHLRQIHHHLFQDLCVWAGVPRTVDIGKGSTRFCTWTRIEPEAIKLFRDIHNLASCKTEAALIENASDLFSELNVLHPFRDGNGRALRLFFEEIMYALGYELTWPAISQDVRVNANIAGVDLDLEPLKHIFGQAITAL